MFSSCFTMNLQFFLILSKVIHLFLLPLTYILCGKGWDLSSQQKLRNLKKEWNYFSMNALESERIIFLQKVLDSKLIISFRDICQCKWRIFAREILNINHINNMRYKLFILEKCGIFLHMKIWKNNFFRDLWKNEGIDIKGRYLRVRESFLWNKYGPFLPGTCTG